MLELESVLVLGFALVVLMFDQLLLSTAAGSPWALLEQS